MFFDGPAWLEVELVPGRLPLLKFRTTMALLAFDYFLRRCAVEQFGVEMPLEGRPPVGFIFYDDGRSGFAGRVPYTLSLV